MKTSQPCSWILIDDIFTSENKQLEESNMISQIDHYTCGQQTINWKWHKQIKVKHHKCSSKNNNEYTRLASAIKHISIHWKKKWTMKKIIYKYLKPLMSEPDQTVQLDWFHKESDQQPIKLKCKSLFFRKPGLTINQSSIRWIN